MDGLLMRRAAMMALSKKYFHFIDPEVESVVANWIGDGIGTTLSQIQATTSLPKEIFRDNADIVDFSDFDVFTGLTSLPAGDSSSNRGAFGNMTSLEYLTLPSTIRTIGAYSFNNDSSLKVLIIPDSVTSIGNYTFYNCISLGDLYIPCNISNNAFRGGTTTTTYQVGSYTGDLTIKGNMTGTSSYTTRFAFNNVYFFKNAQSNTGGGISGNAVIRIKGNAETRCRNGFFRGPHPFIEVMGDITSGSSSSSTFVGTNTIPVLHFGKDSLITAATDRMRIGSITKIYVGDGSSKSNDEAVLALYNANSNWSSYTAKLATWWDYNGTYKWYRVTDTLTNCTNTNPVVWPFITRNDSYETTIVANEGYTLSSVQVLMYQCQDDTATPSTPTDVTSSVYDSSTGYIYIEHVVGNIEIIATAV